MSMTSPDIHSILLADDGSPGSDLAMKNAIHVARQQQALLTILHVAVPAPPSLALAGAAPQPLQAHIDREPGLDLRMRSARVPSNVSCTTRIRHGAAADEILAEISEGRYDIVMLGARGAGRLQTALLGSVSARVLSRSPVPVAIFHAPAP